MSNVNADATQLLTILKNMRTSISSIETTRSSVKMKYQQLGIGWNDKKYDELGTIVKDCNKALNDILQIMLQAEKYVASLAKSVQEYASCNYRSNLSNTPEFAEALVEDGQRILSLYNNLPVEKQTAFLTRIRQDSAHSFSDLIDATTNGQLHGNYGHSRNYWTRPGNLQAEAFAHFFEASMGDQGKLELLANFFPTAFGIFSSMIDSIRPDNHVRVLSRER